MISGPQHIQGKVTAAIVAVCMVVFIAFGLVDYTYTRQRLLQQLEESAAATADRLAKSLTTATWNLNKSMAADILQSELQDSNIIAISVTDRETGNIFIGRERTATGVKPAQGPPSGAYLVETRAILNGGRTIGTMHLYVSDDNVRQEVIYSLAMTLAKVFTTSTMLLLACFWLLKKIIVLPVKNMSDMAQVITESRDYSLRIPGQGQEDEIGTLVANFNKMLETVQGHEAKLKEYSEQLEEKVERRTAELKQTNRELASAMDEAAHANEAKSRFLANMSHEIRTPMNAVLGMCDVALGTELSVKQREYLQIINSSAQSLLTLINDVLDVSKIEAGKFDLERIPFSVRQLFEEVSDLFLDRIGESGLEFILDVGDDVPERVVSDPFRIKQVLVNLVANAFKFTSHGEISLGVRCDFHTGNCASLLFAVRDTGIGIPPDAQKHIFEAFSQADGSTTRKYGGTGLGLSICNKIVQIMGGDIRLESAEGEGTTFFISLPVQTAPGRGESSLMLPQGLAGSRALVVDDNAATCTVLRRYLNSFGLRAVTAGSGEEALRLAHRARAAGESYSLALVDWRLPGINGRECVSRLRQKQPELPVIMMTAHGRDNMLTRLEAEEDNALFQVKPLKMSQLFDGIMTLHGHAPLHHEAECGQDYRPDLSGLRVLLVEDNMVNRRVATEILLSTEARVTCANNGRDAIQALEDDEFDMVLMDVQMPVMDGMEATRHIRTTMGMTELPIIAMTAHAMRGDREKCLASGMDDYVAKPIDRHVLLETLVRHSPFTPAAAPLDHSAKAAPAEQPAAAPHSGDEEQPVNGAGSSVPILDTRAGLSRLGQKKAVYMEILKDFLKTQQNVPERIHRLVLRQDVAGAHELAHSLKGAAGNVSAQRLQQTAEAFCRAANSPTPKGTGRESLQDMVHGLALAMSECREAIGLYLNREQATDEALLPEEGMSAGSGRVLEKLRQTLRESDPIGSQRHLRTLMESGADPAAAKSLERLQRLIRGYDFDKALWVLDATLGTPDSTAEENGLG